MSVPTLVRMEQGDASVGIGVCATALLVVELHKALSVVAAPKKRLGRGWLPTLRARSSPKWRNGALPSEFTIRTELVRLSTH